MRPIARRSFFGLLAVAPAAMVLPAPAKAAGVTSRKVFLETCELARKFYASGAAFERIARELHAALLSLRARMTDSAPNRL